MVAASSASRPTTATTFRITAVAIDTFGRLLSVWVRSPLAPSSRCRGSDTLPGESWEPPEEPGDNSLRIRSPQVKMQRAQQGVGGLRSAQDVGDLPLGVEDEGGRQAVQPDSAGRSTPSASIRFGYVRWYWSQVRASGAGSVRPVDSDETGPPAQQAAPARSRSGASFWHGAHQLAQKLIAAGLPRREARVTCGGTSTRVGSRGACLPVPNRFEVPLSSTIAITATTAARAIRPMRSRRSDGGLLLRRQDRHVVRRSARREVVLIERGDPARWR